MLIQFAHAATWLTLEEAAAADMNIPKGKIDYCGDKLCERKFIQQQGFDDERQAAAYQITPGGRAYLFDQNML
jgi:hypothetical protein